MFKRGDRVKVIQMPNVDSLVIGLKGFVTEPETAASFVKVALPNCPAIYAEQHDKRNGLLFKADELALDTDTEVS
jgi:hypothetical protein